MLSRNYARLVTNCFLVSVVLLPVLGPLPVLSQAPNRWGTLQCIGPDTISDIAAAVSPSVVNLVANSTVSRDQLSRLHSQGNTHVESGRKPRRYYGVDSGAESETENLKVTGSGIVVNSNGYILTSLHVVENAKSVSVTLSDNRTLEGAIIARDGFSDLALIKIPATDLQTVKFGNANLLRTGDWVVAIGNQFGLGHTVTHGLISGLGREAKGFDKSFGARTGAVKFIQTDAPINPGSSGGPLLNLKGEVIGINTFIRDDAQNIGFAIPSNIAQDVAEKLAHTGNIAHPYIGITMKEATDDVGKCVEVSEVRDGSPAFNAGMAPGDLIVEVDSARTYTAGDVSNAVSKRKIGDNVKIKVRRNGVDKHLEVKVQQLPDQVE